MRLDFGAAKLPVQNLNTCSNRENDLRKKEINVALTKQVAFSEYETDRMGDQVFYNKHAAISKNKRRLIW
jgi:hypothetical protein